MRRESKKNAWADIVGVVTECGRNDRRGSIGPVPDPVVSTSLNHSADVAHCDDAQVLADFDALADGAIVEVEALVDGVVESLILHRDGEQARAWLNVCPHAGRRLDWSPGKFLTSRDGLLVCAVHGASFELRVGECVAGPCRGEHLRAVPVEVRNRKVRLPGNAPAVGG